MTRLIFVSLLVSAVPAAAQQPPSESNPQPALPGAVRPIRNSGPGEVSRAAPVNGVLTLFGNQRCPTDRNGNEVVVCVRRGASEQFRVPKELRELQVTEENRSWALKAQTALNEGVGASSIGSCSVVGPGGASGCMNQQFRTNRAVNKEREAEKPDLP